MIHIRPVVERDAEQLLQLHNCLDHESEFMLFEPNERRTTVEQMKQTVKKIIDAPNSNIFVAEKGSKLVGFLSVYGGHVRRTHHAGYVVVGIRNDYTGQGIGKKLFHRLEEWRAASPLTRLELTVMEHNERAFALYKKVGFEVEGRKKKALLIRDSYIDEICMGKVYCD